MNIEERAQYIAETLAELYPETYPPLDHKDPYTLLIAVLLSARCTDAKVNQITPKLFALADNPYDMAKQEVSVVQEIIRPCGLSPQKAKGIVGLSKMLVEQYNGEVPASLDALETFPSVGHKTASVVMVQAFKVPAFPVDTHIYRLARRWRLSAGNTTDRVEKDLKQLYAPETWGDLHLRFIYYGREYCTSRGCDGTKCPMCKIVNK